MVVAEPLLAASRDLDLFARFCSMLVLENGEHMVLEDFQRVVLGDYFSGATETLVLLPKKNGKTSLIGALSLYHLLTTVDAECVIGAASRDQATILYQQAIGLIRRTDTIRDLFSVKTGFREIRSAQDNGRVRVLASDAMTADGVIPTLALVDELHRHRSGDLYGVFRDGLGPRDGQLITISTAGSDDMSPLGMMRTAAYKMADVRRDGVYRYARSDNGAFAMHEWSLDPTDDRDDMGLVKEANPASWQTVERLQERHDSPSTMPWQWARFACGVWVRGFEQWISRVAWDARKSDHVIPDHADVVLGFDGSYNGDSTAIVVVEVAAIPHIQVVECWEPPDFGADDWTVPVEDVEDTIRACAKRWRVREIAGDTYRWQRSFEILAKERLPMVEFPQRPSWMIPAVTRLYEAVMNGGVTHSGDPNLGRHVENACLKVSAQGGTIVKVSKDSKLRIDLAIASVMAFTRAASYRRPSPSVIDTRSLLADLEADGEALEPLTTPLELMRELREMRERDGGDQG